MAQVIEFSPALRALAEEAECAHRMLDMFGTDREAEDGKALTVAGRIAALVVCMAEMADHATDAAMLEA